MTNILRVPSIFHNLLSVYALTKKNDVSVEFFADRFLVKALKTGRILCQGENRDGVYCLPLQLSKSSSINSSANVAFSTWHQRLGHSNNRIVR